MIVDLFDQELPMLASDAAVEIDLLINGESVEPEAVRLLAKKLEAILPNEGNEPPVHSLQTDTALQNVLGFAFAKTGDDPNTILANLMARTSEMVESLCSASGQGNQPSLDWARAFCLALSQSSASYQQMLSDLQPLHPDRR